MSFISGIRSFVACIVVGISYHCIIFICLNCVQIDNIMQSSQIKPHNQD